jgi:hypothetical protein
MEELSHGQQPDEKLDELLAISHFFFIIIVVRQLGALNLKT